MSQKIGQYLTKFLQITINGAQVYQLITKNQEILNSQLKKIDLYEKRQHFQYQGKILQRSINQRFRQYAKIARGIDETGLLFRNLGLLGTIGILEISTYAFLTTIEILGNQQQVSYWQNQVLGGRAIGALAQTELAHGSNIKGLEVVANFNEKTRTFILNSPTVGSAKFYPGALGTNSTHTLVQAKTYIKGKSIGNQYFVIEIRNKNYETLPGVSVGDIGTKFGFYFADNGYLLLTNVQIPEEAMLNKFLKINQDCTVEGLQNKQVIKYSYGSMLNLRVQMVFTFAQTYILMPTVLFGNSLDIRRNFVKPEISRLLGENLSYGYGLILSNIYPKKIYNQYMTTLKKEDYKKADKLLFMCHLISSSFKALCGWAGRKIVTNLAVLQKFNCFCTSGLPLYFTSSIPITTYQGDNTVLMQQVAKFLYFKGDSKEVLIQFDIVFTNELEKIIKMLNFIINSEIKEVKQSMQKQMEKKEFNEVWNELFETRLNDIAIIWGKMNLIKGFSEALKDITEQKDLFQKIANTYVIQLLSEIPQIQFYGFQVKDNESQRLFSDVELDGMMRLTYLVEKPLEPMQFISRKNDKWIKSKL